MSALVVTVLAQAIALNLGDRTELRGVRDTTATDLEAETRPYVRLALTWPKASVGVGYSPSFLVAPLENSTARERAGRRVQVPDRQIELLQAVDAQASVSFGSATTSVTLSQTGTYAQRNFQREMLGVGQATSSPSPSGGTGSSPAPTAGTPPTPAGTPGTGGTTTGTTAPTTILAPAVTPTASWVSETTTLSLSEGLSATESLSFSAGYGVRGGLGKKAQRSYPLMQGPAGSAGLSSQLGPRDGLSSILNAQYDTSRVVQTTAGVDRYLLTRTFMSTATENLSHVFSPTLSGAVGAGVGYSRNAQRGRPTTDGFLPTGHLGLDYRTILGKGTFGTQVGAQFAPVLDQASATVDWRYTTLAGISWRGKRLTLSASSQAALSATPSRSGGTRLFSTSAQAAYDLHHGFTFDFGGRVAWQEYSGNVTVNPTEMLFVGLSYGIQLPLN